MDSWQRFLSHFVGCLFTRFTVSFGLRKLFSFTRARLSIVGFISWAPRVLFRKSYTVQRYCGILSNFFSSGFRVSDFRLVVLFCFVFSIWGWYIYIYHTHIVQAETSALFHFRTRGWIFSIPLVRDAAPFPCVFLISLPKESGGFNHTDLNLDLPSTLFYWSMPLFLLQYHTIFIAGAL